MSAPTITRALWRITLPDFSPPSLNTWLSRHWSVRHGDKKFIEQMVKSYAGETIPRPIRSQVGVWVTVFNCRMDIDNAPYKAILDGLRYAGILKDDDPRHVAWFGGEWARDKNGPRVVIEISEVEG
jgi:Holliday junction resolvase RusA-like endonuclease